MDENRLYPKQFCDLAGMLSSRAAKTCESVQRISVASAAKVCPRHLHMFPGGISSCLGQGADRSAHGLICDFDESAHQVNEPR